MTSVFIYHVKFEALAHDTMPACFAGGSGWNFEPSPQVNWKAAHPRINRGIAIPAILENRSARF